MTVPGNLSSPLLATAAAADAAAAGPTRSLRLNSADTAYLSRTPSSAGNRRTWTVSFWIKKVKNDSSANFYRIFGQAEATHIYFYQDNINFDISTTGSAIGRRWTNQVFRDNSAFFHCVCVCDTTASTASERMRMYINGSEVTSFSATTDPSQNVETSMNTTNVHTIGYRTAAQNSAGGALDAYIADFYLIDGSALDPTSFGAFDDNGVWQAAAYSGTFGTNGFHLKFDDITETAAADSSGNDNDFTVNNIAVGGAKYSSTLTATLAHPSGRPASNGFDGVASSTDANSFLANSGGDVVWDASSYGFTNVKVEVYVFGVGGSLRKWKVNGGTAVDENSSAGYQNLGTFSTLSEVRCVGISPYGGAFSAIKLNGVLLVDSNDDDNDLLFDVPTNGTQSDTGAGGEVSGNYATLNPLQNALDLSNGNLTFDIGSRSNWKTAAATFAITSGKWFWEITNGTQNTSGGNIAYGIRPISYTSSTTNELGYDDGAKAYFATGGTRSGDTSSIASYGASFGTDDVIGVAFDADAGSLVFYKNGASQGTAFSSLSGTWVPVVALYTGGTQIGTDDFHVNFGQRPFTHSAPSNHKALCTANLPTPTIADGSDYFDTKIYTGNGSSQSITGLEFSPDLVWLKSRASAFNNFLIDTVRGNTKLLKANSNAAETTTTTAITSFDSNGFSLGSGSQTNANNDSMVAWTWDAGSSTVSNTDGSVTSNVRVSQAAGFSIVSYTATGSNLTVGHGLNATPAVIITKDTSAAKDWLMMHESIGVDHFLKLNLTQAKAGPYTNVFTSVSNTTFGTGNDSGINTNGNSRIAYCFAPVAGYSAFGSYTGNGTSVFVYTGFRPKFIMTKGYSSNSNNNTNWNILDTSRDPFNEAEEVLAANNSDATLENTHTGLDILSNGFCLKNDTNGQSNYSGYDYIYVAFAENPFQANGGLAR